MARVVLHFGSDCTVNVPDTLVILTDSGPKAASDIIVGDYAQTSPGAPLEEVTEIT